MDPRILWLMAPDAPDPAPIPPGPAWQRDAACLGKPTEMFFPEGKGTGPGEALKVCAGCPVRVECYEWAEAEGFVYGVFGGLSERQRRAARHDAA